MTPYGYIYQIKNKLNGKLYIGQTIQAVNLRWNQHVCQATHGKNVPFSNAIVKHGREAFVVCVLTTAGDQATLNLKEKLLIRACRSMDRGIGYNCRHGGAPGKLTEEHKRKIGAANAISLRGRKEDPGVTERRVAKLRGRTRSQEEIAKTSAALRGRKQSPEHREKNRQKSLGKKLSPEHRAKISAAEKGRVFSPEHIEKIRQANLGKKRGPLSPEHRQKLSLIHKGRVVSAETRTKLSEAHRGKKVRPETKALLSQIGRENPRARSAETGKFLPGDKVTS